jgi:putative ABC transport system ATP-binding protein
VITATGLRKTYGKGNSSYDALRGINLQIESGCAIAVVGKSGSGKSTLMHILAGLDHPTEGSVQIDNEEISKMGQGKLSELRNKKIGFVFQQFFLQPSLTVLENIALPLTIAKIKPSERTSRCRTVLSEVGLADKENRRAVDLSGGEKQRTAIARALVTDPQIIFADEPTGNLDTENSEAIMNTLFDLQKKRGLTLILVTHDDDLAKRCDQIIYIKDGAVAK